MGDNWRLNRKLVSPSSVINLNHLIYPTQGIKLITIPKPIYSNDLRIFLLVKNITIGINNNKGYILNSAPIPREIIDAIPQSGLAVSKLFLAKYNANNVKNAE